jgi:DNA-binding GntR family transcriptional regulator
MKQMSKTSDQVVQIVERLRGEILSGALKPDVALKQESIAARFGVSRMPVREALKQLEMLGFVTVNHNKRTHVAATSLADFLEIYDMRISAEVLAIRSAIPHLTNAQIEEAGKVQAEIEQTAPQNFGPLNAKLHTTLYEPSGRPRLLGHIRNLGEAADRYMFMVEVDQDFRDKSNQEHHELINACFARDADVAARCLKKHIGDARDKFAPMFGIQNGD